MLEASFKSAARWAYALNQGPAKVVLDPLYSAAAAALTFDDVPLSKALKEHRYPEDLHAQYRTTSRKTQYFVEDWDFSEAKPELLSPRQRKMLHTAALGETSGTAVSDGFLRAFRTDAELAAFFGLWFVEEWNHYFGFHRYLERMNEAWPEEKKTRVAAVDFRPYADDLDEIAACNMYQELVGFLIYRSWGRQCADPFLAKMLAQFSKDECRHYKFYQSYVARKIQRDPGFRRTVMKVFLKATTPFNQVSEGPSDTIFHLQMGAFFFRKPELQYFLDELEYLLGARHDETFSFFFRRQIPPCAECAREVIDCDCERYDPPAGFTARKSPLNVNASVTHGIATDESAPVR